MFAHDKGVKRMDEIGTLLTTKEVAEHLRVSVNAVKVILRDGKIKGAFKLSNEWRIPEKGLEEYIKELQQKAYEKAVYGA